jgi:hypothetical protein
MRTITVMDKREGGNLGFDLRDLLSFVAPTVLQMTWRVRNLECIGERADDFHNLAAQGDFITGDRLIALAAGVEQVIEGEFFGYEHAAAAQPTLVIRAVDSSSWDIASSSKAVLDTIRVHFVDVFDAGDLPI